jgi:hypothetical protein
MLNLFEAVRAQCDGLDPSLVEMHFRRLPTSYFERYSPSDIVRHLRLLADLGGLHLAEIEVRPLASQAFEVVVVGMDFPGTVASITAALAAYGFDLEDVQVSPYLDTASAAAHCPGALWRISAPSYAIACGSPSDTCPRAIFWRPRLPRPIPAPRQPTKRRTAVPARPIPFRVARWAMKDWCSAVTFVWIASWPQAA